MRLNSNGRLEVLRFPQNSRPPLDTRLTCLNRLAFGLGQAPKFYLGVCDNITYSGKSAWFNFSYTWLNGMNVIGMVNGNLQADKNTVKNLSNVCAFVKNSHGVFISEFFDVPILAANNHLTLDGSSLEFGFTNNKGDIVNFFGATSNFMFITSVIIDRVRVIPFENINPDNWSMFQHL